jgi:fatty acid desaturase
METNLLPEAKGNRTRGWVLIVLGLLLTIGMAGITFYVWQAVHSQGQPGGTPRWTGGTAMTARTFQLFATLIGFGVICLATGIFQVRTGRRNMGLVVLLLLLVGVMIFLGKEIMQLAG